MIKTWKGIFLLVMGVVAAGITLSRLGPAEQSGGWRMTNLGSLVNSPDSDFGPIVSPDGEHLFFTSDREGGYGGQDIWVSDRKAGAWGQARNLGDTINTKYNEGPDCINVDNTHIYFTRCDKMEDERHCDIYMGQWDKVNMKWSNVENLGPNINSKYNDSNAAVSHDENTLYFVSDRPRQGAKPRTYDIYVSRKVNGVWQRAELMGPEINTPSNEFHVFLSPDGQYLYFSSDGYGFMGSGDADIYRSRIEGGKFGEPEFMMVYNSEANDMYYSEDAFGDIVYLASNREGGSGMEDIYSAPKPLELQSGNVIILWGIVANRKTCAPPTPDPLTGVAVYDIMTCTPIDGAQVRLAELPTDQVIMEKVTGPDGKYQVAVFTGKEYTISATAPEFTFTTERVNVPLVPKEREIVRHLLLEPLAPEATFVLNNIYFDFDKATLRPESKNELDNAIRWLQQNPTVRVEVGGHTDSKGSDEYNIRLSQRRAQAVVDYLVAGGIAPSRLEAHGYGERMPIASNVTDEGRQLNRRVEFKILP